MRLRSLGPIVSLLVGLLGEGRLLAQPKICGNQTALGSWNVDLCPTLRDDGQGADDSAGDGIYSVELSLDPTSLLEYKVLPQGTWAVALGQQGSCDGSGNPTGNDTANLRVVRPDVRRAARFYFDTRALTDPSYATAPGNRSFGDTLMIRSPADACPRWFVVGDFQNLVGVNGTAVELSVLCPGVLVGRHTASKSLPSGWKWKVMEQADAGARELGPSGYASAPCSTPSAAMSQAVSVGDTIYFVVDTRTGRLQAVVSGSPLDGFAPDGTPLCPTLPVADMAGSVPDLAGSTADLAALDGSVAGDAGSGRPLPGIHCDCQIGRAPREDRHAWLAALSFLSLVLLRRRRVL